MPPESKEPSSSPEPQLSSDQQRVIDLAERLSLGAQNRRRAPLPESLDAEGKAAVLRRLKEMDDVDAIALNVAVFPASEEDVEWLLAKDRSSAAVDMAGRLSAEFCLQLVTQLMNAQSYSEALRLIGLQKIPVRSVPASVADELVRQGRAVQVGKEIQKFSEGLSEASALAFIQLGRDGVGVLAYYADRFVGLSQATFDSLQQESPELLRFIANKLARFHGLDNQSAALLRAAGFEKEVESNPESFL